MKHVTRMCMRGVDEPARRASRPGWLGRKTVRIMALEWGMIALLLLANPGAWAQQSAPITLKGGISYPDASSNSCEQQNLNNPFAGMNPLVCRGVVAQADSNGKCTLGGWQVLKQVGLTCVFCAPNAAPPNSIIIPLDQVGTAQAQGYECAADQADACMSICAGGTSYNPQGGVPPGGLAGRTSAAPPTPPTSVYGMTGGYNYGVPPGATACAPFGKGGYDYCQNPKGTRLPAGCVCNYGQPIPAQPPASNGNNQLLADAETILQNAGRISKSMTDAMDVTKHNDVGINVAVSSAFGAMGRMMGVVSAQYRAIALAGGAAAKDASVLQIAGQAATESGAVATQAEQAAQNSLLGATSTGAAVGSIGAKGTYLEGAILQSTDVMAQGSLPTCAVLSCIRLSELLNTNVPVMRILESIKPTLKLVTSKTTGKTVITGGMQPEAVAKGLNNVGITAEVKTGINNLMDQVRAGKPVIAGMYTSVYSGQSPLHAVVVEAVIDQGKQSVLRIYDPVGTIYLQPVESFAKYFTQTFVMPL